MILRAGDTISGQEATAKIMIRNADGSTTIEDAFFAKDLEATVDVNKAELKTLGKRGTQHKPNGWTGTGSMNIYYITSIFRKMILQYVKTGVPVYFDMIVTNNDPGSTVGSQTTVLKNCSLDSVIIAKFDIEAEALDEGVDFTFDDVDMLDEFGRPISG